MPTHNYENLEINFHSISNKNIKNGFYFTLEAKNKTNDFIKIESFKVGDAGKLKVGSLEFRTTRESDGISSFTVMGDEVNYDKPFDFEKAEPLPPKKAKKYYMKYTGRKNIIYVYYKTSFNEDRFFMKELPSLFL